MNPELDMKVTAIEPDRDDFDRLDQLQEEEADDGDHLHVNASQGSQFRKYPSIVEGKSTMHQNPRIIFSDAKSKLNGSQEQTDDVDGGSFVVVLEGENVQSSRYSEERPELAAVVDSHEVNIEMLSSDEGEQQANRFSLNNIHKKSGRSPYFEGGPVSPHRE